MGTLGVGGKDFDTMADTLRRCYINPQNADKFLLDLQSDSFLQEASQVAHLQPTDMQSACAASDLATCAGESMLHHCASNEFAEQQNPQCVAEGIAHIIPGSRHISGTDLLWNTAIPCCRQGVQAKNPSPSTRAQKHVPSISGRLC